MEKFAKELVIIIIGNLLLATSVGLFLLPSSILSGGLSGVSILLTSFIDIPRSTMIFILSVTFLLLGWMVLGHKFMINTCLSSFLYPFLLMLVERVFEPIPLNPILASIYGGLLGGIGIGMVVKVGASTGGMDIPPLIINKFTGIKVAYSVTFIDAVTVLSGLYIFGLEEVLIGLLSVYSTGIAIDKVISFGGTDAKEIQIISKEYQLIVDDIHNIISRGTTIVDVAGGYTNEKRKMILVAVSKKEYPKLLEIINKYDSEAFVISLDATNVHGQGFTELTRI